MPPKVVVLPGLRHKQSAPPSTTENAFVCTKCGARRRKWSGMCDACGAWSSFVETSIRPFEVTDSELTKQLDEPVPLRNHPRFWLYRDRFVKTNSDATSDDMVTCVRYAVLKEEAELARMSKQSAVLERRSRRKRKNT